MTLSSQVETDGAKAGSLVGGLSDMLASHQAAVAVVREAIPAIEKGAALMAETVRRGSTLHYAAAGSSALMALADASELNGTFGTPQSQIAVHMAGGVPVNGVMPGNTEDSADDARRDAAALAVGDLAIIVSASGTTPYALAFAEAARMLGVAVIGIANKPGSALIKAADVAIALPTAPEFIEGSTRLGAGTAQKVALNMMSTRMGMLLGHVHEGMMVNLIPDNLKLRKRAADIVRRIAAVTQSQAEEALEGAAYDTKAACLVARGLDVAQARALLDSHDGNLSACLADRAVPRRAHSETEN